MWSGKTLREEEEMLLHLLMRAALWLLVRVSMGPELSELRVASGLATGAVDLPLASPVQRRMNCSVGPWENVSNGGNLCGGRGKRRPASWSHGGVKKIEEVVHNLGPCLTKFTSVSTHFNQPFSRAAFDSATLAKSMVLIDWLNKVMVKFIQSFQSTEKQTMKDDEG